MINPADNKQINTGIRLAAMMLDHFFMTMAALICFIPAIVSDLSQAFKTSHQQVSPGLMTGPLGYIGLLGFALYFCKDSFNGRSIAKRILKLQVVDNITGQPASPLQCFVRNILCVLWPVEVIVAFTNTSRRLGDLLAGTKLVRFNPAQEQSKSSLAKILLPLLISYAVIFGLMQLLPKIEPNRINYTEASYNQPESKALEQLLTDSLGTYFIPDIRIYDTVKDENLKYISIILKLKKNYIEQEESYRQLNGMVTNLIYTKYPEQTFTGQLQYLYKATGQFQGRTMLIGTHLKHKERK